MSDNVRSLRPPRVPWDVTVHAAPGARFVTPQEFQDGLPATVHRSLLKQVVVEALVAAADQDGVLLDFHEPDFFNTHVAAAMLEEPDDGDAVDGEGPPLVYDQFTALALMDCLRSLMTEDRLLANRGNGDTRDVRLTLPSPATNNSSAQARVTDEIGDLVYECTNRNLFLTHRVTEKLFELYDIYPKADPR